MGVSMKNLIAIGILLFSILGLTGCNDYQKDGLVSEEKGMYSLYVVGDDEIDIKLEKESEIDSVFRIQIESIYDNAKNDTPYLEIDKNKPNYYLFNTKDLVFQTTSYDKLVKYLIDNPEPK
jgi:hypothetical protein